MTNTEFITKLTELKACKEAIEWIGKRDFKTSWDECERADWMLWLICIMNIGTREERIHTICDCAETTLKYVPKGEDRPRLAIEAARKYADEPTPENLNKLNAARADAWAAWAAGAAARAAAGDAAGAAAGDAAWAAACAAARDADWAAAHKNMCNLIRKRIKIGEKK